MSNEADRVIDIYKRHAAHFDEVRVRSLFEKPWLDRFTALLPKGGKVLDLGCGMGEPIARYFIETGFEVTGVDSSPAMIERSMARFPNAVWHVADMRAFSSPQKFDGILGWDSYFFLRPDDQRKMFATFRKHAAPHAALMFNTGPRGGESIGEYQGEPLYHASLEPDEYRALLRDHGFEVVANAFEDAEAGGRTVWLARKKNA